MRDWRDAWDEALYGAGGFFRRGERPATHFRTAPLVGPELAEALLVLLDRVDAGLGRPARLDFVDLGAGGAELAAAVAELAGPVLRRRLRVTAVELVAPRPRDGVEWRAGLPAEVAGLLVGHEWLDAVPCPVASVHSGQVRRVLVDVTGTETLGEPTESRWLHEWWPVRREGDRAEIGEPRDTAWADAVRRVRAGAALAIDYGHLRTDRAGRRYRAGTLAAFREGRSVSPVPDGSCDITAHVALDACAAAGEHAGATSTVLASQRDALGALGLAGDAPAPLWATTDPATWLTAASRAGRVTELRDPSGLGRFGWLLQTTAGTPATELLPDLPPWCP
ncbi:hypothetical protein GCM10012275_14770 [Longimycelium tulufanense]|uniref:SAM-dependent MidA family methyltransferase n=1 Tax=Longimycelium tulufanense TaxID=907463 RepID=A0A8J3CBJ7_9PSEU|nr:SAM-dependent methyltransferase [Longimycelium tulufanense]GGM44821.1 hypothetical protein GCM10012275_14770 [Longimycelium tulufanense]